MSSAAMLMSAALPLLAGCSLLGSSKPAAATASMPTASSAKAAASASGHIPMSGPIEAANALPKECSQILTTEQLQAVFGAGLPIGVNYGSYAALPSIGRTGRVACVFGVGLDSFGKQSAGALEVSISTYTSAATAVGRAADTVQRDSQAGATEASVSVGGHPATVVVEQTPVGATTSAGATAAAAASATASAAATASATASARPSASAATVLSPTASPSPTAPANTGETELVMADGNRTFVLQVPFAKLAADQAVTALTQLTLEVYQNTLPTSGTSNASASASPSKA
jgi:hypothetical protein